MSEHSPEKYHACPHTGMSVEACLCMVHDPDGAHFRAARHVHAARTEHVMTERMSGFRKPLDSGVRKPVGLAVIKSGQTESGAKFAECSCGAPFTQQRDKVREDAIDRHINRRHHGRGIRI